MTAEATVYIVDDDEAIRDSLALLLGAAGFSVVVYGSAEAFLITAPQGPGCVVIDVRMPGMGGLEL
jgi:two-component system, LuxR family, response regulator FixJ